MKLSSFLMAAMAAGMVLLIAFILRTFSTKEFYYFYIELMVTLLCSCYFEQSIRLRTSEINNRESTQHVNNVNNHKLTQRANNVNIRNPFQRVASQVEEVERLKEGLIFVMQDSALEQTKVLKQLIRRIDILTEHINTLMLGHEDLYAMACGLRDQINELGQV
jgi:hypothetical protein